MSFTTISALPVSKSNISSVAFAGGSPPGNQVWVRLPSTGDRCEQRLPLDPFDLLIDPIRHRKRLHAIFDPLDVDDERCLLRRFCVARTAATHLRFSILLLLLLRRLRNERKRRRQILS